MMEPRWGPPPGNGIKWTTGIEEQRLLLSALRGGTDEELADALGISLSAVKKTWRLVYDRVVERLPEMMPDHLEAERGRERGKEKKQQLLSYLREHPGSPFGSSG
jgi:hypothetical protein